MACPPHLNGYLYFTANQLHRQAQFHQGQDQRQKPYALCRVHVVWPDPASVKPRRGGSQ